MNIETRMTQKRGCGYRKPGGLYLVSPGLGSPCCKLPFILTVCPCCGAGIKPTRGWTWIDADALFGSKPCMAGDPGRKFFCPLAAPKIGRAGLLWIGEAFYPTPDDFSREAAAQGISRRIKALPKDFKVGETWVLLAHRKGVRRAVVIKGEETHDRAIFHVFKPTAVEYVVKGTETDEALEKLVKRGITPVRDEVPQGELAIAP
jgi:hypothetical protein